ncbi:hypothetical protein EDD64_10398 [Effusibacillus lacus]|nr:hypothetical protein EDD64_10398 [Effusibacillus lacus]
MRFGIFPGIQRAVGFQVLLKGCLAPAKRKIQFHFDSPLSISSDMWYYCIQRRDKYSHSERSRNHEP